MAALALVYVGCQPVRNSEKPKEGTPVDCTYSLPNLAMVNQFILQNPNDPRLFRIRSQILLDSGDYKGALHDAKRALSLDPQDLYNYVVVGKAHRSLGQIDSAVSACITAEKAGLKDPDNYMLLGDLFLIVRQYNKSLEYLNQALKQAPYEPRIYFLKGLLFAEQGDTAKAVSNWQTSIEQDASYGDGYARLSAYYMGKRDYTTAEQYLRSGLRLRPNDPMMHYNFGVFLGQKGFIDSAITEYREALRFDKDLSLAITNLGILEFHNRNYKEAVPLLQKAVQSEPKNASLAYFLGLSYKYLGELEPAETELDKVVKFNREYVKEAAKALEAVRKLKMTSKRDSL